MAKAIYRVMILGCLLVPCFLWAQGESFSKRTVVSGLNAPWEVAYGPNDSLWVTENVTYLVKRVNLANGATTTLLDLSNAKNFFPGDGGRWPQGGLMGMAIHPHLYSANAAVRAAKPWVYLAYVYERPAAQNCATNSNSSNPCQFKTRIVRYSYSGNTLINPEVILDDLPGSNDHNSGRLAIGPDLKLYYTIGDMGAGQFNNASRTNNAQQLNIAEGKILRLNTDDDGDAGVDAWVPNDNPFYNGPPITPSDYVYTLGHRNAQGLVWADVNGSPLLFASEHADRSDDEINQIIAGSNYGWNRVAGFCDGNYDGKTLGGYSPVNESAFCTATSNYRNPLITFFTASKAAINGFSSNYLTWPTVAPASIEFYGYNSIPGWQNSLLIPCLKAGTVYRIQLNAAGTGILPYTNGTDTTSYFRGEGRFRDMALAPDGLRLYLACDASGQTSGPTGSFNGGGTPPPNAGSILEFTYTGTVLAIDEPARQQQPERNKWLDIFPNPFGSYLNITSHTVANRPLFIQLYNAVGMPVKSVMTAKADFRWNLQVLIPGVYFVEIKDKNSQVLKSDKLIKL